MWATKLERLVTLHRLSPWRRYDLLLVRLTLLQRPDWPLEFCRQNTAPARSEHLRRRWQRLTDSGLSALFIRGAEAHHSIKGSGEIQKEA